MKSTIFYMDPERLFEFVKIPSGVVVPEYVYQELYDDLWAYWLNNCRSDCRKEYNAARDKIAKRQKGWVSIADMRDAGFTEFRARMIPESVVRERLNSILSEHCPC